MLKKLITLSLLSLLLFSLAACSDDKKEETQESETEKTEEQGQQEEAKKQQVEPDKTVAKVNGEELKGSEYNMWYQQVQMTFMQQGMDPSSEESAKKLKQATLDQLVGQELLVQEAKEKGYEADEEKVNEQLKKQKEQFDSEEKFKEALKKQGLTVEKLKADFADQMATDEYIKKEVEIEEPTDKEIQDFFDQYKEMSKKEVKLADVKEQIVSTLKRQKRNEALGKLIEQLKKDNEVEILI
ncbi:SurA N-terminal domain-containing protein [Salinibacillus xinjiangensis]|uniref:SurA N-terminal domain-containing protein n=1 Tax=Salinibacillus xinjiangensis TaxID=1229268 RepID=UPI001891782D|nr:SurA N-terminal domain-containing protein [Salinibacillus xinjiangensis]